MSLNIARSTGPLIICPGSLSATNSSGTKTHEKQASQDTNPAQSPSKQAKDVAPFMGFMPEDTSPPALSLDEFLEQNHPKSAQQKTKHEPQTQDPHQEDADDLSSFQVEDIDDGSVISFLKTEEAKDILLRLAHQPNPAAHDNTNENLLDEDDVLLPALETSIESDDGSGDEAVSDQAKKHRSRSLFLVDSDNLQKGSHHQASNSVLPVATFLGSILAFHMVGAFVAHETHALFTIEICAAMALVVSALLVPIVFSNQVALGPSAVVIALYGLSRVLSLSLAAPRDAHALWTLLQTGDLGAFVQEDQGHRMRTRHHQPNYMHLHHSPEPWRNIAFYEGACLLWAGLFLLPHLLGMTSSKTREQSDPNQMAAVYGGAACCVMGLLTQLCANPAIMELLGFSDIEEHSMMSDQQLMLDLGELGFWYGLWMMNVLGKPMSPWKQVLSMGALATAMVCTHIWRQGSFLLDPTQYSCPNEAAVWESAAHASFLQYDTLGDHDRISSLHNCISAHLATSSSSSARTFFGRK